MTSSAATAPQTGQTGEADGAGRAARVGLIQALGAYGLWGLLPIYFALLAPSGGIEIVAWRIVLSLVFCLILLAATGAAARARAAVVLRDRRAVLLLGLASVLILINWTTYVLATLSGHVVEAALGYFLNPIVTVLLGVVVLRERLRVAQWIAIGISVVAALVLAVGYGQVPWISLILAFSFGLYGLVKNRVGGRVDALAGLTIESAWLTPLALGGLVVIGVAGGPTGSGLTLVTAGPLHTVLLLLAGVITAVPLLLFAAAARRIPLSLLGLTQYVAPVLQLVIGVLVLHEPMPLERWIGFALVWIALIVLSTDALTSSRRTNRERMRMRASIPSA